MSGKPGMRQPLSDLSYRFLCLPEDESVVVRTKSEVSKLYKLVRRRGGRIQSAALVTGNGWRVWRVL